MRVTVEFYRTRPEDDARALLARVTRDAENLADAIDQALALTTTLSMPQKPDAVAIIEPGGTTIFEGLVPLRPD
ncbi:MAG: hypothetical protein K5872_04685 [Rhizobiaceae bacterium]|nr:hypothetical protein [Rhizobiaceae bacterium]MCV0405506.1 hypothetical protein [Rhizobiaceae bacterium]